MRAGLALAIWIGTTLPALAGGGFDIVIPGRPGVPIIINGIDASYAVIEGEWGLGRGEQVQPTIYGGRYVDFGPRVGHYYPSAGRVPGSYSGCDFGCGGWAYERLPDPVHQYYYVNQGPTYSGPGNFAPYPTYQESALGWDGYRRHRRPHVLRRYY
jgi:hypothetical protein